MTTCEEYERIINEKYEKYIKEKGEDKISYIKFTCTYKNREITFSIYVNYGEKYELYNKNLTKKIITDKDYITSHEIKEYLEKYIKIQQTGIQFIIEEEGLKTDKVLLSEQEKVLIIRLI